MQEIEARRRADVELQRAKEAAEAANRAKSRYLQGMSHELRSPLNSILGFAHILQRDGDLPTRQQRAALIIQRSGEHLLGLIDGLLDIARIEGGKLRLEQGELDLPEFLEQMEQMFQPQAADKRRVFRREQQGRLPRILHANAKRLRQILINLLSNAIKFTDRGELVLRVSYANELARFEVQDTGIGISAAELGGLFQPFERSRTVQERGDPGLGLGLVITKALTELMGGELSVASTPGSGSRFTARVCLPEVASSEPRADIAPSPQGCRGVRRRILVVDDDAAQRAMLIELLVPIGFVVLQAARGQDCLDAVAVHAPDLILLDIGMLGMDGWEVCRRLRNSGLRETPCRIKDLQCEL